MLSALGVIIGFSGVWVFLCNHRSPFSVPLMMAGLIMLAMGGAFARDLGQWENSDPEITAWFRGLQQPDNQPASCCGEADSYFCSEHATKEGQIYCIIDDERDNEKLKRTPFANGTIIPIPREKLNHDPNMVGRAIVFLSSGGRVYCFIGVGGS